MPLRSLPHNNTLRSGVAAVATVLVATVGSVTTVHAQVPVCGPHEEIVNDGGTLVCAEVDPYTEPDCPPGWYYDRPEDVCKVIVRIDCGPNPYRYNDIGGHWERRFNKWCYDTNHDPFERLFHDLTYGEALDETARPGSPSLEQLGSSEQAPVASVPSTPKAESGKRLNVDCGQNPYNWNTISGRFERPFSAACLPFTGDPNEALYDGQYLN